MLWHDEESYKIHKDNIYNNYVKSLCARYVNQTSVLPNEINQKTDSVKPLIANLVYCVYSLAKRLSYLEINQICYDMITLDRKDFCIKMYEKYQNARKIKSPLALETLLHTLLLRDFYTGDFEKVSHGGNFAPLLLNIADCYLHDRPYQPLCDFIHYPIKEVRFTCDTTIKCFMKNCETALVPDSFDKILFEKMVRNDLEEIVDSIYNLFGKDNLENKPEQRAKVQKENIPYSWGAHITPRARGEDTRLSEKKVAFIDALPSQNTVDGGTEKKKGRKTQ